MELFSKEWVKELKLSEKTPIEYTDKEDITSIAFYRDKDCKEAVKGFVESGQTIYVRVTTRGLDDSNIALFVYRHGMVTEEEKVLMVVVRCQTKVHNCKYSYLL